MAQDATGTPTSLWGIPKFNTAVDPPSGKGTNAMMDFIDGIIIPDLLLDAKGDIIAATAADTAARLAVGANGTFLKANSATSTGLEWGAAGSAGYSTSLPGSPTDGQEHILVDSTSAPTYFWLLRYNSGSGSTYKWECIGGTPKSVLITTSESISADSYTDLATVGPDITLPNAGDWDITIGALLNITSGAGFNGLISASYAVGGVAASDDWSFSASANGGSGSRTRRHLAVAASTLIRAKYHKYTGTAGTAKDRQLSVMPVRII